MFSGGSFFFSIILSLIIIYFQRSLASGRWGLRPGKRSSNIESGEYPDGQDGVPNVEKGSLSYSPILLFVWFIKEMKCKFHPQSCWYLTDRSILYKRLSLINIIIIFYLFIYFIFAPSFVRCAIMSYQHDYVLVKNLLNFLERKKKTQNARIK